MRRPRRAGGGALGRHGARRVGRRHHARDGVRHADAVYAAGAGDEIRILGGAHRIVEIGATTNGLVLAQEGLRLAGWGSVPPLLVADEDVPRSRGEALVHLAGANQVVSNLCFRFSGTGAGEAAVIAVEAP